VATGDAGFGAPRRWQLAPAADTGPIGGSPPFLICQRLDGRRAFVTPLRVSLQCLCSDPRPQGRHARGEQSPLFRRANFTGGRVTYNRAKFTGGVVTFAGVEFMGWPPPQPDPDDADPAAG